MVHPTIKQQHKEQLLKNEILAAEKLQFKLKLDLKELQASNQVPPLQPIKEENIETIRMPNIPSSKRKASCNGQEPASKLSKNERYSVEKINFKIQERQFVSLTI